MTVNLMKGNKARADEIDDSLGFRTPILKGFLTEMGIEAASLGVQLYGGHGYIKSNKQEQVYRDVRIAAIWEGTTGEGKQRAPSLGVVCANLLISLQQVGS